MDAFSYLSVLLSIVLGLAMTQVLQGFRGLILTRATVAMYWPCVLWAVLLLVIDVQAWWAMYGLRDYTGWNFLAFAVVLMQTVLMYLIAGLVLPDIRDDRPVDLRAHYFDHARWFFGIAVAAGLVSISKDLVLYGTWPEPANLGSQLVFMATCAVAIFTRNEAYHKFLAVFISLAFCAYIGLLFAHLH
ncbi:MAG TPA: hypothetical protein VK753_00995 [Xanthomonadaceae bacterium]|jgi:hypothetical protein|nr:hypothetical protein [Xanthomonadaceae bacterium]